MKNINLVYDKKKNAFFSIEFEYEPVIVDAVKKIPNRAFNVKDKTWNVKSDHTIVQYIEVFAKYFEFEISSEAQALLDTLKTPASQDIVIPPLKMTLRNFQKIGVAYAVKFERCFIADEMGLGKSCESIVSVETVNAYPCLIICPASLKLNWQREVNMWVDRTTKVISGEAILNDYDADFIIINYDIAAKHEKALKKINFKSIILDESHYLKNHKAQRTKSVKALASKMRYRFALSGTPILNKPRELMPQLDIIDRLQYLGGFWTFAKRYCGAVEGPFGWDFSGATNLDELNAKMNSTCYIRRLKSEVLDELPPKQRTYIPIEIDNRDEYKMVEKDFIKWVKNKLIKPEDYAKELEGVKHLTARQKKLLVDAKINLKLSKAKASEALIKIEYLKQIAARGKLSKIKNFIDNVIEQGEKLVVFANHEQIQRDLYEHYRIYNAARIFSEDDVQVRQANVDRFQQDPDCPVIICSLVAGGVGWTLTQSNKVAFAEFGWTPAVHDQAEDRCHRIGQKDFVNCYYFYGKNTIDEQIIEVIDKKRNITNNVIDGISMPGEESDISEILKKFI